MAHIRKCIELEEADVLIQNFISYKYYLKTIKYINFLIYIYLLKINLKNKLCFKNKLKNKLCFKNNLLFINK